MRHARNSVASTPTALHPSGAPGASLARPGCSPSRRKAPAGAVENLVQDTVAPSGGPDILVHNATVSNAMPFARVYGAVWAADLDLKMRVAERASSA